MVGRMPADLAEFRKITTFSGKNTTFIKHPVPHIWAQGRTVPGSHRCSTDRKNKLKKKLILMCRIFSTNSFIFFTLSLFYIYHNCKKVGNRSVVQNGVNCKDQPKIKGKIRLNGMCNFFVCRRLNFFPGMIYKYIYCLSSE